MKSVIVPFPCKEEVKKYLNLWNSLPDYVVKIEHLINYSLGILSIMII